MREGLCSDLSFSVEDRKENMLRTGEVAKLFYYSGFFVLISMIAPFREEREYENYLSTGERRRPRYRVCRSSHESRIKPL